MFREIIYNKINSVFVEAILILLESLILMN